MVDIGTQNAATLFARLLALSREAHLSGHHEVAFHALSAALHAAEDARSSTDLVDVQHEAESQLAWIDEHVPTHRLGSKTAGDRGHPPIFTMLARRAATQARLVVLADETDGRAAVFSLTQGHEKGHRTGSHEAPSSDN